MNLTDHDLLLLGRTYLRAVTDGETREGAAQKMRQALGNPLAVANIGLRGGTFNASNPSDLARLQVAIQGLEVELQECRASLAGTTPLTVR